MENNALVLKHTHASFIFPYLCRLTIVELTWKELVLWQRYGTSPQQTGGKLMQIHVVLASKFWSSRSELKMVVSLTGGGTVQRWDLGWTSGNSLQISSSLSLITVSRCLWKVWRALWLFCGETTSRTHACDESSEVTRTTVGNSSCRTGLVQTPSYYIYIVPPTEKPETEEETSNTYVE